MALKRGWGLEIFNYSGFGPSLPAAGADGVTTRMIEWVRIGVAWG